MLLPFTLFLNTFLFNGVKLMGMGVINIFIDITFLLALIDSNLRKKNYKDNFHIFYFFILLLIVTLIKVSISNSNFSAWFIAKQYYFLVPLVYISLCNKRIDIQKIIRVLCLETVIICPLSIYMFLTKNYFGSVMNEDLLKYDIVGTPFARMFSIFGSPLVAGPFFSLISMILIMQLKDKKIGVNALSLLLVFLENYFIVFLQSKKIYIFSSIQGIILNASLILYLLFFYKYGIWGIVITKIAAHLFNVVVLIAFVKNRKLFNYSFYINFKERYVKEIIRLASPVFILNLISQLNYIVDRSMASSLDSGSMALLNYANVIASLLYSVLGTSLTTMAYTEMSACQNNTEKLQKEFSKFLELLVDIITPACIVMIVMRENIVSVFYGRGQISGESLKIIMLVLILYIPSNYLMSLRDLMNRLMYINKKTTIPSIITGVTFGLNIFLNLVLVKYIGVYVVQPIT